MGACCSISPLKPRLQPLAPPLNDPKSPPKGIGENSALVRALVCDNLERLGVLIDADANVEMAGGRQGLISRPESRVKVGPGGVF